MDTIAGATGGWLAALIVAGLAWVGWQLLTRRAAEGTQGLVWMLVAIGVGAWFIAAPGHYLRSTTEWSTGASAWMLGQLSPVEADSTGTTTAPDLASYDPDQAGIPGEYGQVLRRISDRLYRTLAYEPWAIMQLGSIEAADWFGYDVLTASTISVTETEQIRAGTITVQDLSDRRLEVNEQLQRDIADADPAAYRVLEGDEAGSQLGLAVLTLVAALASATVLLVVSLAMTRRSGPCRRAHADSSFWSVYGPRAWGTCRPTTSSPAGVPTPSDLAWVAHRRLRCVPHARGVVAYGGEP